MSATPEASPRDLLGAEVTVMGLGLFGGGAAACRWLVRAGARVTVTDLRDAETLAPALAELAGLDVRLVLGEHREEDFTGARMVVANPAVAAANPLLALARGAGAEVTSELELFLGHVRAPVVLISGTHGKSSTASILAQILEHAGSPARLGGNIGTPLLGEVDTIGADETVVLEVSSYQLDALARPARDSARGRGAPAVPLVALTNVTADHLERHGSPRAYALAKARILELLSPGGAALLPARLAGKAPFALPRARIVSHGPRGVLREEGGRFLLADEDLGRAAELALPGEFQRANALVALGAARLLGAAPERLRTALSRVRGLPHRLEDLGVFDGVRVIDNGVSTTPESTLAALEATPGPCTLLIGGRSKRDLGWDALAELVRARATRIVTFGADATAIHEAFARAGVEARCAPTLEGALELALGEHRSATLLFSPACASFDAYSNFRARALDFRRLLRREPAPPRTLPSHP